MIRPRHLIALALGLCIAAPLACGDASARTPVRSLREIRQADIVMQKWDNSCGAAALATVLTYGLDHPISEQDTATGMLRTTEPLKVRYRGGFSLLDMKRFVASRGFDGAGYRDLALADLSALTDPIVSIMLHGYAHFVVVRAITDEDVSFADPAYGNRTMSRARFAEIWTNGIAFVVTRRKA